MTAQAPRRRESWHDVVDAQGQLARWLDTPQGELWLGESYSFNAKPLQADTQEMLAQIYGTEPDRVRSGEPIFVSGEMCDVIESAMGRFEPEALLPMDLMTTHGFLMYERPFEVPDRFDMATTIAGFSWLPYLNPETGRRVVEQSNNAADGGTRAAYGAALLAELRGVDYSDPNPDGDNVNGIALTIYAVGPPGAPRLLPFHITPWWFGMSFDGNQVDENGVPTGAAWWWKVLQTTFRLMQQQLSVGHRYRPDRAGRRSLRDARMPEDRDVIVVRLRRERQGGPADDGPHAEANYSHRFIVNGHWRNQWYPSENLHRQIYIAPFVKGDPDLPLIIRPNRAFTWNR